MLLAMIMMFSFAACGGTSSGNGTPSVPKDAIVLTPGNYEKYFSIETLVSCDDELMCSGGITVPGSTTSYIAWYKDIVCQFNVWGASQNFNYNDVVVECKIKGKYGSIDPLSDNHVPEYHNFEIPMTLELNIAGKASEKGYFTVYTEANQQRTVDDLIEYELEIVSISGYLTNA